MEMFLRDRQTLKIGKKNMGFTSPPDPLSCPLLTGEEPGI